MAKRNKGRNDQIRPAAQPALLAWPEKVRAWFETWSLPIAGFAVLVATLRIVATYPVFNHTIDEPAHVACGMEWLSKGTYELEPQHPPLARIFSALGPFLAGERSQGRKGIYNEGAAILYNQKNYQRNLTLARMGTLPFFWMACAVVYLATARWYGKGLAAVAAALFSLLPPILAHASLATIDMALTATMGLACFGVLVWAENPTSGRGAAMGICCALAVLSKFSSLAFLPACLGAILAGMVVSHGGLAPVRALMTARHGRSMAVAILVRKRWCSGAAIVCRVEAGVRPSV